MATEHGFPPTIPTIGVLVKLGSIAVHADEYLSIDGLPLDKMALDQLLGDPEVVE